MQPGSKLAHYEIVSALGRGGMGEVWKARDTNLGREVAIKVLPTEFVRDREHLARFRREAQAASALNHPNICTIYDLGEHDQQPFMVMELLKGETLRERLARGSLSNDQVFEIGVQVAQALDAAHSEGIIHRDIKPDNIFITDRGAAKILDFGLARMQNVLAAEAPTMGEVTEAGTLLGTVSYMSPEQARGEELDARSDLFSLGVVLYQMTTGQPAFTGNTTAVIFERIFNATPDPPTRLNPNVSRELDGVIGRLLVKDRHQRTESARALCDDLERARLSGSGRQGAATARTDNALKSIAVLPFENLSADAGNEYFSDGLTDEIITDLSQIRSLRVISRNSSIQLKRSGKDLKTVAEELNVRYLLEGSVRKAGSAVRVTAQLIDPVRDQHLWAQKYSGQLEDIFEIQEQISRQIVDALKMRLSPSEDQKLAERPIDNVAAFECYHRARREIYKFTPEGIDRALELINQALEIVGDNELLYATQGTIYWQCVNAAIKSEDDLIEKAEACARRVFEINPESAAGYGLLGMVRQAQGRPGEAARSYKRALALQPDNLYAVTELGRIYMCVGYYDECRSMFLKGLALDPVSAVVRAAQLSNEYLFGQHETVEKEGPEVLALSPLHICSLYAMWLIEDQQADRALEVLEANPDEDVPTIAGQLCEFLKLSIQGKRAEAETSIEEELLQRAWKVEWWSWQVAARYALIDEEERAIDWLENASDRGFIHYPFLAEHSRVFRKLDDNPRFQRLLNKVRAAWEQFEP